MSLNAPLKIGSVEVTPGILLAPMEDVSEPPFRLVCRELGADIVYTEFVNAEGLLREDPGGPRRSFHKTDFVEAERPVGIQLYGASEFSMEDATRIATELEPDLIDINCGCWVSNVALRGAGAGLLRDPEQMQQVARRVVGATHLPVTVKTRLGWDVSSINIVDVAKMLEGEGIQALAIHCRTRAQGHKGDVDYSWIPKVKKAVGIPVILNGDITSAQQAADAFTETDCDGVMIGRGAIRHPWLFSEIRHFLETGKELPAPTPRDRVELCRRHLRLAIRHIGERRAIVAMRRHYAGYFRELRGAAQVRAKLATLRTVAEIEDRLDDLKVTLSAEPNEIPAIA
ncbi:MAG: tRNA dihydrouridine synthase DusB [Candidatus Latescibacterota bacterium]|nr:tRNA dihydrouridine synthase DusB [Candidatus Latescibacterota bacterium]